MDEKEKIKAIADLDQGAAFICQELPVLWFQLYRRCVEEGFSTHGALEIVKQFIHSTIMRGAKETNNE